LGHGDIVFQLSRFDLLVASFAVVDVDVNSDRHVEVDITNAHLETAVIVTANNLCVADIRVVTGLNAIGIGCAAILGAARAVVPLAVRVSSADRRAIVAAILASLTLFMQRRHIWPGDIPKLWSSGLDVASLNLGYGLVDGRRHSALEEGIAVKDSRKLHDCVV
jgi:hypothetical protein